MREEIAVIGLGNFGTALANYLGHLGHNVLGYSRNTAVSKAINSTRQHPAYLKDIKLSANLIATDQLGECLKRPVVVIALPAHALGQFASAVRLAGKTDGGLLLPEQEVPLFISATKGLPDNSLALPTQFLTPAIREAYRLGVDNNTVEPVVLTGPCFANDLARGLPAGLVAASSQESMAQRAAKLFSSAQVKVYISDDPVGAQIGGIVKNVIAIATGISDGLGLGESARAGLITRGLAEILRFALAKGAKRETVFGLSGLGDLSMTCTSTLSRNHTVGLQLGQGKKLAEILTELGSVAEGVRSTPIIAAASNELGIEMPITQSVLSILEERMTPLDAVKSLVMRPVKREF